VIPGGGRVPDVPGGVPMARRVSVCAERAGRGLQAAAAAAVAGQGVWPAGVGDRGARSCIGRGRR